MDTSKSSHESIIDMDKSIPIKWNGVDSGTIKSTKSHNNPGGGPTMDDKYATKEELHRLEDKMDYHFDKLDSKIDNMVEVMNVKLDSVNDKIDARVAKTETHLVEWAVGTAIAIVAALITFIH